MTSALVAAFAIGCSTPPPAATSRGYTRPQFDVGAEFADAPIWVTRGCRRYWTDPEAALHVVCGLGSAPPARNRRRVRETAVARARSEITRSLAVTIEDMIKQVDDSAKGGLGDVESLSRSLAEASLPASEVKAMWEAPSGSVHALVVLTLAQFESSIRESESTQLPTELRAVLAERAVGAFAELDAETSELGAETGEAGAGASETDAETSGASAETSEADAAATGIQAER